MSGYKKLASGRYPTAKVANPANPVHESREQISNISRISRGVPVNGHFSPVPCPHAATYRRPSGVAVCLDCASTLAPGAPSWQPQTITYCEPGTHVWVTGCEAHAGVLQCAQCPEVHVAKAADSQRNPAIHDPHCAGMGLVVVPSWGWSCPTCDRRYVVPEAPASSTPAQAALPLGSGVPHGEVVPSKRRR